MVTQLKNDLIKKSIKHRATSFLIDFPRQIEFFVLLFIRTFPGNASFSCIAFSFIEHKGIKLFSPFSNLYFQTYDFKSCLIKLLKYATSIPWNTVELLFPPEIYFI